MMSIIVTAYCVHPDLMNHFVRQDSSETGMQSEMFPGKEKKKRKFKKGILREWNAM